MSKQHDTHRTCWISKDLHQVIKTEAAKRDMKLADILDYFLRLGLEREENN